MRYTTLLGIGLALLSSVNSLEIRFPPCAEVCLATVINEQSDCSATNTACICASNSLAEAITACVSQQCTVKESFAATNATSVMCGAPIRSRSNTIMLFTCLSGTLAFIATCIRTLVAVSQGSFGLDDASAIVAELACIPFTVFVAYLASIGFGRDTWTVDPEKLYTFQKLTYVGQGVYFWSSGFTKLCFLFFFLRIFPSQRTRRSCHVAIGVSVLYTLAYSIAAWLQCKPISASWEAWDGEHGIPDYCIDLHIFWFAASGTNIALDLVIAVIPIPGLIKLNLSWRKKASLCAIFGVGIITIVVSCIRLPTLKSYGNTNNPLWDHAWGGMVSAVELNVGITCICMPSFRRFMQRFLPGLCGGTTNPDSKYKPYDNDNTPSNRLESKSKGLKIPKKKKTTLDSDLLNTITKTVDTRVVTVKEEDDEIRLVELKNKGNSEVATSVGSAEEQESMYSGYKKRHQDTLPNNW